MPSPNPAAASSARSRSPTASRSPTSRPLADLARDAQSTVSAKGVVFPKVERLLKYRFEGGKNVAVDDVEPNAQPTVLFGVRPCEARAFHALDVVFNWDYKDKFFNARLANTTVVALSCTKADESCFCTSRRLAPRRHGRQRHPALARSRRAASSPRS